MCVFLLWVACLTPAFFNLLWFLDRIHLLSYEQTKQVSWGVLTGLASIGSIIIAASNYRKETRVTGLTTEGGIFISYRRTDAKHAAGRLVERLQRTFSNDQLFLDIDKVDPGLDFKKVVAEKLQACKVLLVVIGPNWLLSPDESGARRLDDPRDLVRLEIEAGLEREIRVIPVLVDGARMPTEEHLPHTLRPLAHRNAVRLEHERFASDADGLVRALAKIGTL